MALISTISKKIFGTRNSRFLKKCQESVVKINDFEAQLQKLTDEQLKSQTEEFKQKLSQGSVTLDSILPKAFAVVREASLRTLKMRHFDVQLIGGMVLHKGMVAEMQTGEGKTLAATLAAYLNSLTGKGVHIVTVNDYLAQRDADWMRPIYEFLGLTVGVIVSNMPIEDRIKAYAADVTYGTNNEFGFDYLRDNMALSSDHVVQKNKRVFAIIDEVDSILIDEARTPLIISGPTEEKTDLYIKLDKIVVNLVKQQQQQQLNEEKYFTIEEKHRQVHLTEEGHQLLEKLLCEHQLIAEDDSLYEPHNISLLHFASSALKANTLFHKDIEYIIQNKEIVIIDEQTGRAMPGRRWSEGIHQAIEAKEGVPIANENQVLATITFQNYFRSYDKLSGMTGTADTEAFELHQIYDLEVIVVPPNKPSQRLDHTDLIFLTLEDKCKAIIADIKEHLAKKQPILVGTTSIESSEHLSKLLRKENIAHNVLNAKQHQREAEIIANAGLPCNVTIATNMAGRGTDIVLGGNLEIELKKYSPDNVQEIDKVTADWQQRHDQVVAAGGLYVIGSERHDSRRIDNQLRGRSGRQGDPGETRFYLSLDDALLRRFASQKMIDLLAKLGMEGNALESKLVTRTIENAQSKVEGVHYDIRKQLLEFDNISNEQRKVIYETRYNILTANNLRPYAVDNIRYIMHQIGNMYISPNAMEEQWEIKELEQCLATDFGLNIDVSHMLAENTKLGAEDIISLIEKKALQHYHDKEENYGDEAIRKFEKLVLLQNLDQYWKEHLSAIEHLRQGINLRGYAQRDPKREFEKDSLVLFKEMLENFKYKIVSILMSSILLSDEEFAKLEKLQKAEESKQKDLNYGHENFHNLSEQQAETATASDLQRAETFKRDNPKLGRNEPCFCNSGKKYKHCHGKI